MIAQAAEPTSANATPDPGDLEHVADDLVRVAGWTVRKYWPSAARTGQHDDLVAECLLAFVKYIRRHGLPEDLGVLINFGRAACSEHQLADRPIKCPGHWRTVEHFGREAYERR